MPNFHAKFEVGELVTANRPKSPYWPAKRERFEVGQIRITTLAGDPSRHLTEYRSTKPKLGIWYAQDWLSK